MICLHGALGTAAQFDVLRPHFPANIPLVALQLPGHGGLPCNEAYSLPLFAASVLGALDEAQTAQTDLFGYSMGGYLALYLAWKHPERVRKVVLLNTKLDWSPETSAKMSGMFDAEKIALKAPQLADALSKAHAPTHWQTVAQYTAHFIQALGAGAGLPTAAFSQISAPVLVLRGALDTTVTAQECETVQALLPNGQYTEIPESKHALEQVDGAALAKVMLNWL